MKRIIVSMMLLLSFGMAAQEFKVAYVNVNEIFNIMPEAEAAEKELMALGKQNQDYLNSLQDDYQKKYADFMSQQDSLTENIKMMRVQEIQELETRMQNFYEYSQQEQAKKQEDLMLPIQEKMRKAIEQVGDENNYTVILGQQHYLYVGKAAVNATEQVKAKLGLK